MTLHEVIEATSTGSKCQYQSGPITLSTPTGPKESIFVSINDNYVRKLTITNADDFRVLTSNGVSTLVSVEDLLTSEYSNLDWNELHRE